MVLTHFSPVSHIYTPWKRQKTKGFLTFSGGIEMWHWTKMVSIAKSNRKWISFACNLIEQNWGWKIFEKLKTEIYKEDVSKHITIDINSSNNKSKTEYFH